MLKKGFLIFLCFVLLFVVTACSVPEGEPITQTTGLQTVAVSNGTVTAAPSSTQSTAVLTTDKPSTVTKRDTQRTTKSTRSTQTSQVPSKKEETSSTSRASKTVTSAAEVIDLDDFDFFSDPKGLYNGIVAFDGTSLYQIAEKGLDVYNTVTGSTTTIFPDRSISHSRVYPEYVVALVSTSSATFAIDVYNRKTGRIITIDDASFANEFFVYQNNLYVYEFKDNSDSNSMTAPGLARYRLDATDIPGSRVFYSLKYHIYDPVMSGKYLYINVDEDGRDRPLPVHDVTCMMRFDMATGEFKRFGDSMWIADQITPIQNDHWVLILDKVTQQSYGELYVMSTDNDKLVKIKENASVFGIIGDVLITSEGNDFVLHNLVKGTVYTIPNCNPGQGGNPRYTVFDRKVQTSCVTFGGVAAGDTFFTFSRSGKTIQAKPFKTNLQFYYETYTPPDNFYGCLLLAKNDWLYYATMIGTMKYNLKRPQDEPKPYQH